jgi:imidazolonepropionase-like amidohydrolase
MIVNLVRNSNLSDLTAESIERPVWVRVGRLLDGGNGPAVCDADIVFDAKQIHFVGVNGERPPTGSLHEAQSDPDLVLPSYTVLPCLIEAHAHLFLEGGPINFQLRKEYLEQSAPDKLSQARERLPKLLHFGVGAVRDAGDKDGVGLALAKEAKQRNGDLADAPLLDSPGAAIHHRGRYGSFMGEPLEEFDHPAACVAGRVIAGADRIKLLVSGIINFNEGRVTAAPQMDIAEVRAFVDAAMTFGKQTFAHASGTDGVENAIEGGVTTVEHGFFVTEEQLARMRDRQIGWVPTFAPVHVQWERAEEMGWDAVVRGHLERILDAHREMLSHGHAIGVPIVAGSDAGSCGVPHGEGFLAELYHMERAGLSPIDVLHSATGRSADVLNFSQSIGRIAPGYRSRMIFTEHDPSISIANLAKDKMIVFDGRAVEGGQNVHVSGV